MDKLTFNLWFDKEAEEAAEFYTSIFPNSSINSKLPYTIETPGNKAIGSTMTVSFNLANLHFVCQNGGAIFKFNPAISFIIRCSSPVEVDTYWSQFSERGSILMPLGTYPFSDRFGWVQDKYGISWQIFLVSKKFGEQIIVPKLIFVGEVCGKAEEAMNFYSDIFEQSKTTSISRFGDQEAPDRDGTIKHAEFSIMNTELSVMDSAHDHKFKFNEAISIIKYCENQDEIDYYWDKLSAFPEAERCGWLKDKFGISWQIIPKGIDKTLSDPERGIGRSKALLQMKKIIIEELQ